MPGPRKLDQAVQSRLIYQTLAGHVRMTRLNMNNILAHPDVMPEAKDLAAHIAKLTIPLEAALRKKK